MKLLLTGAAGYTGKGLAETLKAEGHWVRGCDVNPRMEHVDEAVTGDIADLEVCRRITDGVEALVLCHMAPNPQGYETPPLAIDVNVKGTANLYHAAVERKLARIRCGFFPAGGGDGRWRVPPCPAEFAPRPVKGAVGRRVDVRVAKPWPGGPLKMGADRQACALDQPSGTWPPAETTRRRVNARGGTA